MSDGNGHNGNGGGAPIPFPGYQNRQGPQSNNFHVSLAGDGMKSFQIMAIVLLLSIGLVGSVAGSALWIAATNHASDSKKLDDIDQWASLVYAHDLQMQALLKAQGFHQSQIGSIPQPPKRGD